MFTEQIWYKPTVSTRDSCKKGILWILKSTGNWKYKSCFKVQDRLIGRLRSIKNDNQSSGGNRAPRTKITLAWSLNYIRFPHIDIIFQPSFVFRDDSLSRFCLLFSLPISLWLEAGLESALTGINRCQKEIKL